MKTLLLTTFFILFSFLPFAYSQNYYVQTAKGLPDHHIKYAKTISLPGGIDSSNYLLNYYTSDSFAYKSAYINMQGQLLNAYYSFPKDTGNSYKASSMFFMNYDCINSISVAFDSLYYDSASIDPWSISSITIDTLYVPIIQVNRSNTADTLDIQLNTVDGNGYPIPGYLLDTTIISNSTNNYNIGAGNDSTIYIIKWYLGNYELSGATKFAVTVNYYDSTKKDSCWFIYGYGSFKNTCINQQKGTTLFANTTHFSKIDATPKPFIANSFAIWNEYTGFGLLPDPTGNNVYYPCNSSDTTFHSGTDGANYLQNIDIGASIQVVQNTGIKNIHSPQLNVNQNYPNPFTTISNVTYSISQSSDVTFRIIDLTGRELSHEYYNNIEPGLHNISINGNMLQPGVYLYSISSSGYTVTKEMVVY